MSQIAATLRAHKPLIALALVGLVDAICFLVVGPSLIFYVQECGGTKEQYGLILSVFSLASFAAKPVLGWWSDAGGNIFRVPYLASIVVAGLGGVLYFCASLVPGGGTTAIALVLMGRILGGAGAANSALGFAYVATTIPADEQTETNSLLSMTRILGMTVGPVFNVFLKNVDATISFGSTQITLTPLNSVGLFLVGTNALAFLAMYALLQDPPARQKHSAADMMTVGTTAPPRVNVTLPGNRSVVLRSIFKPDIALPIFTIFMFNANFQVIETAFPPAAFDALGWGPVQTSTVLGGTSILIFANMLLVYFLSKKKVRDESLVVIGSACWMVGGLLLFLSWVKGAKAWHFVLPIVICVSGFPFIGASNRSLFTKAVSATPVLETRHSFMQAILSMAASAAGFLAPGLVAAFILRHPDEVDASPDHRELNPTALYIVAGPLVTVLGILYLTMCHTVPKDITMDDDEINKVYMDETSKLIRESERMRQRRSSVQVLEQKIDPRTEAYRRESITMMGIPQLDPAGESETRQSLLAQLADEIDDF